MKTIEEIQARKESQTFDCKSIHADAFILKATLMAEWTSENEFDRPSAAQVPPKYRPSRKIDFRNEQRVYWCTRDYEFMWHRKT